MQNHPTVISHLHRKVKLQGPITPAALQGVTAPIGMQPAKQQARGKHASPASLMIPTHNCSVLASGLQSLFHKTAYVLSA